MSGFPGGYGTTDQGAAHAGIDSTIISGNDRSVVPSLATVVTVGPTSVVGGGTVTMTAPGVGKTNYCTAISLTYQGATAASVIVGTVSGSSDIVGGSWALPIAVPIGAAIVSKPYVVQFDPPLQAAATNATLTFSVPTLGAGNTVATATITGYVVPF